MCVHVWCAEEGGLVGASARLQSVMSTEMCRGVLCRVPGCVVVVYPGVQ